MAESSQARLLAPVALVVFAVAFLVVIVLSVSGSHSGPAASSAPAARSAPARRRHRRIYVVRSGDLLSRIADKTGVSMQRLEELNPSLDPQVLVPGQRVKLGP